jgi:hypothetical protein
MGDYGRCGESAAERAAAEREAAAGISGRSAAERNPIRADEFFQGRRRTERQRRYLDANPTQDHGDIDWVNAAYALPDESSSGRAAPVPVRLTTEDSQTPLFVACGKGDVDAARRLLDKGAEVDRANKYGATPLFVACQNGHVDAARLLLDNGADVHKASLKNRTPLHAASYEGHIDVVRLLLANGADADLKDEDGDAPVADAKSNGHSAVVAFLMESTKK